MNSTPSNKDFAILALRKGSMSLSSNMLWRYLLFFVKAVGLIIPFRIRSSRSSPSFLAKKSFAFEKCRSLGRLRKGPVKTTPLTFMSGLVRRSFRVSIAPILCAYMNKGRSGLACERRVMTSLAMTSTDEQPRGPPEYPNPVRSMRRTS